MTNQRQVSSKKPGKFDTIIFGIGVTLAVIIVQAIVSFMAMIPIAVSMAVESGGDMSLYMELYEDFINNSGGLIYLQLAAQVVCFIVVGLWYYLGFVKPDKKKGIYKPFNKKVSGPFDYLFIIFGAIGTYGLAVLLEEVVSMVFPDAASVWGDTLQSLLNGPTIIVVVSLMILAPIYEEIAIRGIVLRKSERVFGVFGCMIISAILFGVLHMNIIQGLYVLPMGLFWGYVSFRYRSVIPAIICHIINNSIGVFIPENLDPVIGGVGIVLIFGAVAVVIGVRKGLISSKPAPAVIVESEDTEESAEAVDAEDLSGYVTAGTGEQIWEEDDALGDGESN
ncbi:MAG: CPBP family intramembrane metalloprotease [Lachnospiraceae bacterium]|nr:CPBP family intramembrane metalloprotease [Lachnospiraceae bacterium]